MPNQPSVSPTNGILELDPENLREIDGVVLDLDSYARHTSPPAPQPQALPAAQPDAAKQALPAAEAGSSGALSPAAQTAPADTAPAAVFVVDPVHVGWHTPLEPQAVCYPIMAGALPPRTQYLAQHLLFGSGSGSFLSSYLSSFTTSYMTSWQTSYQYGSGSWLLGSGLWASSSVAYLSNTAFQAGGYGLELI